MALFEFDLLILRFLNGLCGRSWLTDHVMALFAMNNFIKTAPFIACFCLLWFAPTNPVRQRLFAGLWRDKVVWFDPPGQHQRRETLILMLFAVMFALIANRILSTAAPFRARPVFEPALEIRQSLLDNTVTSGLDHWSSFPSDHAAFLFAMAAGLYFASRPLGVLLSFWSVFVLAPRVYFGIHYPSDLAAGAALGILAAAVVNIPAFRRTVASPLANLDGRIYAYLNGLIFVIVFEMGNLFEGVRQIGKGAVRLLAHVGGIGSGEI